MSGIQRRSAVARVLRSLGLMGLAALVWPSMAQQPPVAPAQTAETTRTVIRYPMPKVSDVLSESATLPSLINASQVMAINQAGPFIIVVVRADTALPPARASELCAAFVRHFRDRGYEVNRGQLIVDRSRARETDCKVTG